MDTCRRTFAIAALALVTATAAAAQPGLAGLRGRVIDPDSQGVAGVAIVVIDQATGAVRETATGSNGTFLVAQLAPGVFTVTADRQGFRSYERTDFPIGVGRTFDLDIVLRPGTGADATTVSSGGTFLRF